MSIQNQLMALPLGTIDTAYRNAGGVSNASKLQKAQYLAERIAAGRINFDWVRAQGITGPLVAPVPASPAPAVRPAPVPVPYDDNPLRREIAQQLNDVSDRIGSTDRALRDAFANDLKGVETQINSLRAGWAVLLDDATSKVAKELKVIRQDIAARPAADPASIAAEVRAGIEDALVPFRAALAEGGEEVAEKIEAALGVPTIIGRSTAAQVFGIDVRDSKGNPLEFDIWNDAEAPAVDPVFIWTESIIRNLWLAQQGANLWFGGEKGTGKSETAKQFAARTGRSITRINFHGYSSQDDYIGAVGVDNGSTGFQPGPFLRAFTRPGTVILLDEPTNAKPAHLAPLNALLEPGGSPTIGGSVWRRGEGVTVFAADNSLGGGDTTGRYPGLNQANSSLIDRFGYLVHFQFLPEAQEVEAVVRHTGCTEKLAQHVVAALNVARGKVSTGEIIDPPSIRSVISFIRGLAVLSVRDSWNLAIAARQPAESALGLEGVYTACINEQFILGQL